MKTYMTLARPAMGDNQLIRVKAQNHQEAARQAALMVLQDCDADFDDDIYIEMVVDHALCAKSGFVFTVEELKATATTLSLGVYGIEITYSLFDVNGCAITSNMKEANTIDNERFNAAVDGLESMILAHFSSGIGVSSVAYLEGIELAYSAISARYSE